MANSVRTAGAKLGQWLDQQEISAGNSSESIDQQLIEAAGKPQPFDTSSHFGTVNFQPCERVHVAVGSGQAAVREVLLDLISDADRRWPQDPS